MKTMIGDPDQPIEAKEVFAEIMSAPELMDREKIDSIISHILLIDGPDGHIDGHEEITDFIMALMNGVGNEWFKEYCG